MEMEVCLHIAGSFAKLNAKFWTTIVTLELVMAQEHRQTIL